jgi:hypothetical protein
LNLCEWTSCRPDNPLLAIRYQSGERSLIRQDERAKSVLYSTKQEMHGRWLDFRFETRFSRGQDGRIDAWRNGESILRYQGPTLYQEQLSRATRLPSPRLRLFKTGLYRGQMQLPMTICLDQYRKDELSR